MLMNNMNPHISQSTLTQSQIKELMKSYQNNYAGKSQFTYIFKK